MAATESTVSSATQARAWCYLLGAGVFEIAFALGTKGSAGFTNLPWSIWTGIAASGGIFLLSLALRVIDVGVGYAVWTGIGSVGTVIIGSFLFDEPLTVLKGLCFVLIVSGVLGLKVFAS